MRTSISKLNEFSGILPCNIISFRHLGFKSIAQNLSDEREIENLRNVEQINGVIAVVVGETPNSPKKLCTFCKMHQWELKVLGAKIKNEDADLNMMAQIVC